MGVNRYGPSRRAVAPPLALLLFALASGLVALPARAAASGSPEPAAAVEASTATAVAKPLSTLAAASATIDVAEVAAGQRGYGLSVFRGEVPERFEVEVIGVVENMQPGTSYILARLSGRGLEQSGVIAGMSGSPVFLDERLAGAVAFSWQFSQGAIAGITPIAAMRALSALPVTPLGPPPGVTPARGAAPASAGVAATAVATDLGVDPRAAVARATELLGIPVAPPTGVLARLAELAYARALPADRLERALAPLRPAPLAGTAHGLAWTTNGFAPATERRLTQWLGAVQPAGRTTNVAEPVLGGAVAAVLVDGDYRLAATGTITDRQGDRLVAFGHPFLGLGPVRLPMASAEVVTVIPSLANSFKLSNIGPRIGLVDEDRQAGIRGRLGVVAPTIPVAITVVRGEVSSRFAMELADAPELLPGLLGLVLYSTLDSATHAGGTQELDLLARLDLGSHGPLVLRQSFDGPDAAFQALIYVATFADFLAKNDFAQVPLLRVDVELAQAPTPRAATVVAGHAHRSLVRPGEEVEITLELVPFRGTPFRETLTVRVPADVPDGRYSLLVGDGATLDTVRMQMATAPPVSIGQVLELVRSFHSRRELVVLGVLLDQGLAVAGEVLPRLPGSMRSLWRAAGSRSATPLALAVEQLMVREAKLPVDGGVRIDLTVERRRPEVAGVSGAASASPPDAGAKPATSGSNPTTKATGGGDK